jgi:hypothetical protein
LLKNDCPAHALFDVPSWNDSSRQLLSIPRAGSQERFERNAQNDKFIPNLLLAMIPVDNQHNQDEREACEEKANEDDAAMWLLKSIGQRHSESFIRAAKELGCPVHAKRMPAEKVAAMMQTVGLNNQQLRKLSSFLFYHNKRRTCLGYND